MKKSLLCSIILTAGCAHVIAYDKEQNTVTVQAGKLTSMSKVQSTAEEQCGGHARLLSAGERTVGSTTSVNGSYGYGNYSGTARTTDDTRPVYVFKCE